MGNNDDLFKQKAAELAPSFKQLLIGFVEAEQETNAMLAKMGLPPLPPNNLSQLDWEGMVAGSLAEGAPQRADLLTCWVIAQNALHIVEIFSNMKAPRAGLILANLLLHGVIKYLDERRPATEARVDYHKEMKEMLMVLVPPQSNETVQ